MRLDAESNTTLVAWVMEQSDRPMRRVRASRRIRPDDLRCHPDLCARLESAAFGLDHVRVRYVVGLPILVHPNGVVFGVAGGTAWMALRLPSPAHGAIVHTEWGRRGLDGDWTDADPWLTDMPSHEGTGRLRGWARASYDHAAQMGPVLPARTRGPERSTRPRRTAP
jgi:hypothetical protein